jgi:3-methyladenine DNA glycosylase AlkD
MASNIISARKEIRKHKDPVKGAFLQRFFKTKKGQYAENDKFLGVVVPTTRLVAKKNMDLPLADTLKLLESEWHEERLLAIFILVGQYKKGDSQTKNRIYQEYLKRISKYVNNWDLVDSSAHLIIGPHLENMPLPILDKLAYSKNVWERRVSIISTLHLIRKNEYRPTLKIAKILLNDKHDLIHKAVGWMLREVGNRAQAVESQFLDKYAGKMPRTMLRYAIEKYPEKIRKRYLTQKI